MQIIIWRDWPFALANNQPEGPALRMIICHPRHPSHPSQDPVSILRTVLEQFVLVAFFCHNLHAAHHRTVYLAPSPVHPSCQKLFHAPKKLLRAAIKLNQILQLRQYVQLQVLLMEPPSRISKQSKRTAGTYAIFYCSKISQTWVLEL